MVKIGIVGSGGREHALGWLISQDNEVEKVYFFPGNAGTSEKNRFNEGKKFENVEANFFDRYKDLSLEMVVVGPEKTLSEGFVDRLKMDGFENVFSPTKEAARIEADKFYSASLMRELRIPQANFTLCGDFLRASQTIGSMFSDRGIVLKARGLTAGKGVYVCDTKEEAEKSLKELVSKYGNDILVCERLEGLEFSLFGLSDGYNFLPIRMAVQDHKRLLEGDKGPNTGGMGAYCPVPFVSDGMIDYVANNMMSPVIKEMAKDGKPFRGFLYAGVILTEDGPKILEYNCRLGDPETQALVLSLNGLYQPIKKALEGRLDEADLSLKAGSSCCVVLASEGYPENPIDGAMLGLHNVNQNRKYVQVFHAGTRYKKGVGFLSKGGRIVSVSSHAETLEKARHKANCAAHDIVRTSSWINEGRPLVYRKDIGAKVLE